MEVSLNRLNAPTGMLEIDVLERLFKVSLERGPIGFRFLEYRIDGQDQLAALSFYVSRDIDRRTVSVKVCISFRVSWHEVVDVRYGYRDDLAFVSGLLGRCLCAHLIFPFFVVLKSSR